MPTTLIIHPSTQLIVQFIIREVLRAQESLPPVSRPHSHSAHSAYTRPMLSPSLYPPLSRPGSRLEWCPTALGQYHCGCCHYPQPRHQSRLKTSIGRKAAHPQKPNFHRSLQAQLRWSSGGEHARPSLSSLTTSIHSVGGSSSRAGYLDSSWPLTHI